MEDNKPRWPADGRLSIFTRWRVKPGKEGLTPGATLRENTVALLTKIDTSENVVGLWINPAIGWEGTYQELFEQWDNVPEETKLTF